MTTFDINDGELLSKVSRYELRRGSVRIIIDVHEVLEADASVKFVAMPFSGVVFAGLEYTAKGNTELEALQNCLTLIKGVDPQALFAALNID